MGAQYNPLGLSTFLCIEASSLLVLHHHHAWQPWFAERIQVVVAVVQIWAFCSDSLVDVGNAVPQQQLTASSSSVSMYIPFLLLSVLHSCASHT